MKKIFILFILIFIYKHVGAYEVISPNPFSIIRSNFIKIQVSLSDNEINPDSVVFLILPKFSGVGLENKIYRIKADKNNEIVYNCSNITDGTMYLKALIFIDGKTIFVNKDYTNGIPIIFDRKSEYKSQTFKALYKPTRKNLRKFLNSCPKENFISNNNPVSFSSAWDKKNLYIGALINDRYLNYTEYGFMDLGKEKNYFMTLWKSDGMEICFDLKHNHSEWRSLDDYEFIANIKNDREGNVWDDIKDIYKHWGKLVKVETKIYGTINNNTDIDSGYYMLITIPWKELNHLPIRNDEFGFDLQVFDKDTRNGEEFRNLWSQGDTNNNDNTSEWGNIILIRKYNSTLIITLFILIGIILLTVFYYLIYRIKVQKIKKNNLELEKKVKERTSEGHL